MSYEGFNPAEAEEGFKRLGVQKGWRKKIVVSIQPKPKKGLKDSECIRKNCFYIGVSIQPKPKKGLKVMILNLKNNENVVSIQPKPKKGLKERLQEVIEVRIKLFQSSRSRRRV